MPPSLGTLRIPYLPSPAPFSVTTYPGHGHYPGPTLALVFPVLHRAVDHPAGRVDSAHPLLCLHGQGKPCRGGQDGRSPDPKAGPGEPLANRSCRLVCRRPEGPTLATSPPCLETLLRHSQLAQSGLGRRASGLVSADLWCCPLICQVNENAKQDLKEGLLLYNTENNVGLKNAWNIIQAEVRLRVCVWRRMGQP